MLVVDPRNVPAPGGIPESQKTSTEKCLACVRCRRDDFTGICPLTGCAKRLLNGPCGGSQEGKCEIDPARQCAWQQIYERAMATGAFEALYPIAAPQDWSLPPDGVDSWCVS